MDPHPPAAPSPALAEALRLRDQGDLAGAARALAGPLAADPGDAEALRLLDEILAASRDPGKLLAAGAPSPEEDAVRAYALARAGQVAKATVLLFDVALSRPRVP